VSESIIVNDDPYGSNEVPLGHLSIAVIGTVILF